uniref:BTB domain-containing protein n=2 Tax=Rhodosorus marinus TaxID=101924 RepID=A0A7S2ZNT2_9RHOD|mmetsp:Transcript_26621/g.103567  ORF Transcript_26621/g.103567 Transcript_26621/m.103567 type:complete len:503 (+) Transcript_26621:272-1780(+)
MAGNLDTNSSFTELCHRCREGDLPAVKDAILSGININARDVWDATPLYYACLTGRSDIVRFLLEAGAVCDVDTFDGERCFYAALNLQVRTLLQTYGDRVLVSHDNRFYRFISSLRVDPSVADFAIFGEDTHEREMLSAAILSARSPALHGFLKRSSDLGRRGYVQVKTQTLAKALKEYIYRGSVDISEDEADEFVRTGKAFGLDSLVRLLEESSPLRLRHQEKRRKFELLRSKVNHRNPRLVLADDTSREEVRVQFSRMVNAVIQEDLSRNLFADASVRTRGRTFQCHKVFLRRCEYFRLHDHFDELSFQSGLKSRIGSARGQLKEYNLEDVSPEAFEEFLRILYTDKFHAGEGTDLKVAVEVLQLSDMLLAPGHFKGDIENWMSKIPFEQDTLIGDLLEVSEVFDLNQLRSTVVEYIKDRVWEKPSDLQDLSLSFLEKVLSEAFLWIVFEDVREESLGVLLNDTHAEQMHREQAAAFVDSRLARVFGQGYSDFMVEYDKAH